MSNFRRASSKLVVIKTLDYTRGNFGCLAQAYALSVQIQNLGFDTIHLLPKLRRQFAGIRLPELTIMGKSSMLFPAKNRLPGETQRFIEDNVPFVRLQKPGGKVSEPVQSIHATVVGSDQVWNPVYEAAGDFLRGASSSPSSRLVSFAASFGVDESNAIPRRFKVKFSHLIKFFDAVSVREVSGEEIVREISGASAVKVLDPVLLLDVARWRSLCSSEVPQAQSYICTYFLDESKSKLEAARGIASTNGSPSIRDAAIDHRYLEFDRADFRSWLSTFSDSDFVLTDSFHGAVFSILFNKPFFVFENPKRGNLRIVNLLQLFGLDNRLIVGESFNPTSRDIFDVDWKTVNSKLALLREDSQRFLKSALLSKAEGSD